MHEDVVAIVGVREGTAELRLRGDDETPRVSWALPAGATAGLAMIVRVHSRAGIPLAWAAASVAAGDRQVESKPLTVLAMEGYAHLNPVQRRRVEERVLARCAYGSVAPL